MNLTRFWVKNLHKRWTFDVPIEDNTLVIVGENGSGKTTLANLMYYFLSRQWSRLKDYQFDTIGAQFGSNEIELSKEMIDIHTGMDPTGIRYELSPYQRKRLSMLKHEVIRMRDIDVEDIAKLCHSYDIPFHAAMNYLGFAREQDPRRVALLRRRKKELKQVIKLQILYLPTYRRIEQELRFILPKLDLDELGLQRRRSETVSETTEYIELVEFGMRDVVEKIDRSMGALKDFVREGLNNLTLKYLSEVIDADYERVELNLIRKAEESTIDAVLGKIDPELLPEAEKNRLEGIIGEIRSGKEATHHTKVIAHFFLQLLYLQNEQERREMHVRSFLQICNSYLHPTKELVYDNREFRVAIRLTENMNDSKRKEGTYLKFKHLSSGEKQIVSLFSHLFLSKQKGFFVIIDEPELSLSVPWQEKFLLDVRRCGLCAGLVAVTHSPFIYANELDKYAHGLNEYRI